MGCLEQVVKPRADANLARQDLIEAKKLSRQPLLGQVKMEESRIAKGTAAQLQAAFADIVNQLTGGRYEWADGDGSFAMSEKEVERIQVENAVA